MAKHHYKKKRRRQIPKGEIWRGRIKKISISSGGLVSRALQNGALRYDNGVIYPVTVRLIGGTEEIIVDPPTHARIMEARSILLCQTSLIGKTNTF